MKRLITFACFMCFLNCVGTACRARSKRHNQTAPPVSDTQAYSFTNAVSAYKDLQWVSLNNLKIISNRTQIANAALPSRPQVGAELEWTQTGKPVMDPAEFLPWACWNLLQVQEPLAGQFTGPTLNDVCGDLKSRRAYIIHIAHWARTDDKKFSLRSNDWYVYEKKRKSLVQVGFTPDRAPILDGDTDALLFGIQIFDSITPEEKPLVHVVYTATPTQTSPQNAQNLAQVVEAIMGVTAKQANAAGSQPAQALVIVALIPGAARLPYKLTIASSFSIASKTPVARNDGMGASPESHGPMTSAQDNASKPAPDNNNGATPSPTDCSAIDSTSKPCVTSHTLQSNDREWWDVSLGVALPGVKQTNFSAPSGTVVATTTTHTDVYAFFNLGYDLQNRPYVPHLDLGIPVAGQPLHRPFVGVGEWLTPLFGLEKRGFPLRVGGFVGVVFAKQYSPRTLGVGSAATTGALAQDLRSYHVRKLLFGLEFSVSELIGRIKSKSK